MKITKSAVFIIFTLLTLPECRPASTRLSFSQKILPCWHAIATMPYRVSVERTILDFNLGKIKVCSETIRENDSRETTVENIGFSPFTKEEQIDTVRKGYIVCKAIGYTPSSSDLIAKTTILALTQSFIGKNILHYLVIPKILALFNINLMNKSIPTCLLQICSPPNTEPLCIITHYDIISYSLKCLQYFVWLSYIRDSRACPLQIKPFVQIMVSQFFFNIVTNFLVGCCNNGIKQQLNKLIETQPLGIKLIFALCSLSGNCILAFDKAINFIKTTIFRQKSSENLSPKKVNWISGELCKELFALVAEQVFNSASVITFTDLISKALDPPLLPARRQF